MGERTTIVEDPKNLPGLEGPKFIKRNGYYYIFAPAGGVEEGWQTILRSNHINGPYEDRIVLHQGDTSTNGPHQGGWVELESGESWFIHFQDKGAYGRIVHLQPVQWVDDWPMMGHDRNGDGIGEPVDEWKKPNVAEREAFLSVPPTSDSFAGGIGLQWQWQANPQPEWYSMQANPSSLRLHAVSLPDGSSRLYDAPQLLLQKLPAPAFSATCKVDFHPVGAEERAGLVVFGEEYAYIAVVKSDNDQWGLKLYTGDNVNETFVQSSAIADSGASCALYLRVTVNEQAECQFSFVVNGEDFFPIGEGVAVKAGKWVGAKVGLFAANLGQGHVGGYADYEWFTVES